MKAAKKPKLGRPPVPKKLAKGSLLSVRFSESERAHLVKAAKRGNQKLSEYARSALLATALVFDDQFELMASRPTTAERAREIARIHLNGAGNAAYLYDFNVPGEAIRVSRGSRPEDTVETLLDGSRFPVALRRLEMRS